MAPMRRPDWLVFSLNAIFLIISLLVFIYSLSL